MYVFETDRYSLSLFTKIVMEKQIHALIHRVVFNAILLFMNDTNLKDTVALK